MIETSMKLMTLPFSEFLTILLWLVLKVRPIQREHSTKLRMASPGSSTWCPLHTRLHQRFFYPVGICKLPISVSLSLYLYHYLYLYLCLYLCLYISISISFISIYVSLIIYLYLWLYTISSYLSTYLASYVFTIL